MKPHFGKFGIRAIFFPALAAALMAAPVLGAEKAEDPKAVVLATVGERKITLFDVDDFIRRLPERVQPIARQRKGEILRNLVNRILMLEMAGDEKIGRSQEVQNRIRQARNEILIQEALRAVEKRSRPTEKELRAEYEKNKAKYRENESVTAAHIMVASEEDAKKLLQKLKKGEKFDELARKYSLAPERGQGGSLGKMQRGQHMRTGLPQIIEETAFSLKPGAYSGAVKSIYGWHVVHSIAKEGGKTLTFEQASAKIEGELGESKRNDALRAALERMKKKHPVKTYPERIR